MLDRKFVEDCFEEVERNLARRGDTHSAVQLPIMLAGLRQLVTERDRRRGENNEQARMIGTLMKQGSREEAEALKLEVRASKERLGHLETGITSLEHDITTRMMTLPNLLAREVPDGISDQDNLVLSTHQHPVVDMGNLSHVDVGEKLGFLDFERGAKLSGHGFTVLRGKGARLDRALRNYLLDRNGQAGYEEVTVPHIVLPPAVEGTGQLPKFADDMYPAGDGWLIPTGEVPLTNLHAGEILAHDALPLKYTAATQCFRREAGAHGALERGLIRQHEFTKVEIVRIERAEDAGQAFSEMIDHICGALEELSLTHRKVLLCAGDTGFSASKTVDIEVWVPNRGWMEVSSVSWCAEFQARRMNLRYRPEPQAKPVFAHTLNGSALPVGRLLVALLGRWYDPGTETFTTPPALLPYMR